MKILFIHQNFPGQFKSISVALGRRGHKVVALSLNASASNHNFVNSYRYAIKRSTGSDIHPWAADFEAKIIRGQSCADAMIELLRLGFYPDVVIGHPGWGETIFVKDIFPKSKYIAYLEFFYSSTGLDVGFDPEFLSNDFQHIAKVRLKNISNLLALESMDVGLTPTEWQKSLLPFEYQHKIQVVHDGIDTDLIKPNTDVQYAIPNSNVILKSGDDVLTFVNRNLEPYRGYHQFMRALPFIQRANKNIKTLIVGGDGVSYGQEPSGKYSYKDIYFNEVKDSLDMSRTFFVGNVPYDSFLKIIQLSKVHVYLTYPFVLSWSLLEAMSAGCLIVGSMTPPVQEVLKHHHNGLLVDFFDREKLIELVVDGFINNHFYSPLKTQARQDVIDKYDLKKKCLPRQIQLIESLMFG